MKEVFLSTDTNVGDKLWESYADAGYSRSGHIGFRAYAEANVHGASVSGTTATGITLKFQDEADYTMFMLKWL